MSLRRGNRTGSAKRKTTRTCPRLEALEQRLQLSTFRVNTTLDTVAVNLHTGKDSSGHISLRSAIMAADAHGGSSTIIVPAGTFTLTIPGANEDASATGDLDLKGKITIKGASTTGTVIDGNNLDRVFQVLGGKVSISKLTIQHGRAAQGAGILNSGGQVTLSSVRIVNNVAVGGAGLNGADGSGGGASGATAPVGTDGGLAEGGGILNAAGSLSISNSTISSNLAVGGNGGNGGMRRLRRRGHRRRRREWPGGSRWQRREWRRRRVRPGRRRFQFSRREAFDHRNHDLHELPRSAEAGVVGATDSSAAAETEAPT